MDSPQSEYIFETTDPLNNIVYLTPERMVHINEHVEMIGEEQKIKEVVENPDYICQDADFDTTNNYYGEHHNDFMKNKGKLLKVVVDRDLGGAVITAFPTWNVKKTEKIIYQK